MPTSESRTASDSSCGRPWTHLYLSADCAHFCPLPQVGSRVHSLRSRKAHDPWDYYTSVAGIYEEHSRYRASETAGGCAADACGSHRNCACQEVAQPAHSPGPDMLDFLAVSITDYCRGNCIMCFQSSSTEDCTWIPEPVMADLAAHARAKVIHLLGGELFHLPAHVLHKYLDWAGKIGQCLEVTTAGDGFNNRIASQYPWNEVRFSIDAAAPELFHTIRPGIDYAKTWKNLCDAVGILGDKVVVLITAMSPNLPQIPDLLWALRSCHVKRIRINPVFAGGRATGAVLAALPGSGARQIRREIRSFIEATQGEGVTVEWPLLDRLL